MPLSDWFRRAPTRAQQYTPDSDATAKMCEVCRVAMPAIAQYCFVCGRALAADRAATGGNDDPAVTALQTRLARALDGRYRVREVLGAGGMGVVFLADDVERARPVAVKVLRPDLPADANGVARFRREAEIAARLRHPGIIPIHHVGSDDGLHYFVMEYVSGHTLEALLRQRRDERRPLPLGAVLRILGEAATTLDYAHAQGVVHRDVKPGNIMLDGESRVLLTDFGISKSAAASTGATTVAQLTETGTVLGTPHYLAPEQALSRAVDGRADQYALAIVAYEMLIGEVPFDDETPHGIIHHHINDLPPRVATLRPEVPPHVSAAIARALMKAPSHRFATMSAFATALEGRVERRAGWWRTARWAAALLVGALLVAGGVLRSRGVGLAEVRRMLGVETAGEAGVTAPPVAKPVARPASAGRGRKQ